MSETSIVVSETNTDAYVIICVTSFVPLIMSLVVTLILYRKFLFMIEETMCHSNEGLSQESNLNRL